MDKFMFGLVLGYFVGVFVMFIIPDKRSIKVKEKIVPEWELTTNGKVVDTLYIYKEK